MTAATSAQIKAIHTLKSRSGLEDADYRALLAGFGVGSSRQLTLVQATDLLNRLRVVVPARAAHPKAVPMTGRYGAKIRALWIAGWNLGVVRDRSDEAACAFVERQTGVMRTAWLVEPAQGRAAIEALKHWLSRQAGVEWPGGQVAPPAEHKLAVLQAQWRRLVALGVVMPGPIPSAGLQVVIENAIGRELACIADPSLTSDELDRVSAMLGGRIRKAIGRASS